VVFYDGDVPMSLPEFGGMDTGFNYYHGADPGEYDLVISNSEGGLESLLALGGRDFQGDTGRARLLGDIPFNAFSQAISAARVNLCITRRSHASVHASSSCRPFELASAGAAIVANPYEGIERWFEPGRELLVVEDAAQAVDAYRELLADPAHAEEMGRRARERVLDEHTYVHRARQLLALIGVGEEEAAVV
jgi:glycosyltransferase involved in cell wall biosynthesis